MTGFATGGAAEEAEEEGFATAGVVTGPEDCPLATCSSPMVPACSSGDRAAVAGVATGATGAACDHATRTAGTW